MSEDALRDAIAALVRDEVRKELERVHAGDELLTLSAAAKELGISVRVLQDHAQRRGVLRRPGEGSKRLFIYRSELTELDIAKPKATRLQLVTDDPFLEEREAADRLAAKLAKGAK